MDYTTSTYNQGKYMLNITIPTQITNNNELLEAQALRAKLKEELKAIEEQKEKVSRPLLDAIAARRAEFAPTIKKYTGMIESINSMLSIYQESVLALQKQAEDKILSDGRTKDETKVAKLSDLQPVSTTGFRRQQVLKVTDINKIPNEYFILDESKLLSDLKDGKQVEGAEIGVKMIPTS